MMICYSCMISTALTRIDILFTSEDYVIMRLSTKFILLRLYNSISLVIISLVSSEDPHNWVSIFYIEFVAFFH